MIVYVLLYAAMGLLACFTVMLVAHKQRWDKDNRVIFSVLGFFFWPCMLPFFGGVIVWHNLDALAQNVTNR